MFAQLFHAEAVFGLHVGMQLRDNGEEEQALVQDLVMLQVVQQGGGGQAAGS